MGSSRRRPWTNRTRGTGRPATLRQIPLGPGGDVAEDDHRGVRSPHRQEEAKLILRRLDLSEVEDEVAAAGQLDERLGIGLGEPGIGPARHDLDLLGGDAEVEHQLPRLGVRVRQEQIDGFVKSPPPGRPSRADRPAHQPRAGGQAAGHRLPLAEAIGQFVPGHRGKDDGELLPPGGFDQGQVFRRAAEEVEAIGLGQPVFPGPPELRRHAGRRQRLGQAEHLRLFSPHRRHAGQPAGQEDPRPHGGLAQSDGRGRKGSTLRRFELHVHFDHCTEKRQNPQAEIAALRAVFRGKLHAGLA